MLNTHNTPFIAAQKGIYYLRNIDTDWFYIGMTTRSFRIRWNEHYTMLKDKKHYNTKLQRDFDYGNTFAVGVLLILHRSATIERAEKLLIDYYKNKVNLYNAIGVTKDVY